MTLPAYYDQATDPNFRLLAGYTSPPRVGQVTSIEASGQVRVSLDDPDGGTALAWPLNGFTYGVDDIVYVLFVADSPELAIVLGARSPMPTLDADVLDADYVQRDGTTPLSADWDVGEDRAVKSEKIQARDEEGVSLVDDAGNVGVHVADGGEVGIKTTDPEAPLHVAGTTGQTSVLLNNGEWLGGKNSLGSIVRVFGVSSADHVYLGAVDNSNNADVIIREDGNDVIRIAGGLIGFGVAAAQGKLHAHDGHGGMLFVSKTGITGSAQTIIPGGTGDVGTALIGLHVTAAGGTPAAGLLGPIAPGGSQNVVIGGNTYQYAVSASGALTVQRTAGVTTGTCALLLLWS